MLHLERRKMMGSIRDSMKNYVTDIAIRQSQQTAETYAQGMQRFKEFLIATNRSPDDMVSSLSADYAVEFAEWLSAKGKLAKTTLHTYFASITRFYKYLLREEIIDLSVADLERMRSAFHDVRHGHRPLPKLPPDEAVVALLNAARGAKSDPKKPRRELTRLRNIAMLEALRSSGMRVGELVTLKRDDLDYRLHTARVTGKGDKQRIVYFDDAAWSAIQTYLKERGDGANGRALYQLPLFARHDRRVSNRVLPMTTDSVRLVFNALSETAGIEIVMTPHSLRHAFATKVLEATGDLAVVQDMLGHSSPATTRIYAKVSNKKMREAHRVAFNYRGEEDG
ncbi:Tyrosine recombinase XerC [Anaerolineae bacterium]|nr:Tyrosine recombinase XerC [Anaerolineae bacterium]